MNEVKNVIGLLCKHLNVLFHMELKPEHFRLAKFNKTEEGTVSFCFILFLSVSIFILLEANSCIACCGQ